MNILNIEFKILTFLSLLDSQKWTFSKFLDYQQFVKNLPSRDNIKIELNNKLILRRKEIHESQKQSMYVGQASIVLPMRKNNGNLNYLPLKLLDRHRKLFRPINSINYSFQVLKSST